MKGRKKLSEKEILDDVAFDIGLVNKFIEDGKWKSEELKIRAYEIAAAEIKNS